MCIDMNISYIIIDSNADERPSQLPAWTSCRSQERAPDHKQGSLLLFLCTTGSCSFVAQWLRSITNERACYSSPSRQQQRRCSAGGSSGSSGNARSGCAQAAAAVLDARSAPLCCMRCWRPRSVLHPNPPPIIPFTTTYLPGKKQPCAARSSATATPPTPPSPASTRARSASLQKCARCSPRSTACCASRRRAPTLHTSSSCARRPPARARCRRGCAASRRASTAPRRRSATSGRAARCRLWRRRRRRRQRCLQKRRRQQWHQQQPHQRGPRADESHGGHTHLLS